MSDLDLRAQAADLEQISAALRPFRHCEGSGCGEANPIGIADAALAAVERVKARLLGIEPRDWPAFWATLTDAEAAACLRAAPRVAGEWEKDEDSMHPTAQIRRGRCADAAYLIPVRAGWEWWLADDESVTGREPTADLARAACDSALRASGWRVL